MYLKVKTFISLFYKLSIILDLFINHYNLMLNHKLSHLSPLLLYLLFYLTYTIPNCGNGIIQAA